jgi:hypothetical protein
MKRALVVGIDAYPGSPLRTSVADARAMAALLERHDDGTPNYEVRLATSDTELIDRTRLRALLAQLFANARDSELLFYFSGHGAESPWGAEIVTQDFQPDALGVSMNDLMALANAAPAQEIVIILDCCYSGQIGNIPRVQAGAGNPALRMGAALIGEGVTLLAASHAEQVASSGSSHSAFTSLLINGLTGAAADQLGHVTALSLYDCATRAFGSWDQRPLFKSHVTKPSIMRTCNPWIDPELLRRLPDYFAAPDARVRLSPAYEGVRPFPPGAEPTAEQRAFDYFRKLRNAVLLTTNQNKDLYYTAMDEEEVFLTRKGQYFWRLASERRL